MGTKVSFYDYISKCIEKKYDRYSLGIVWLSANDNFGNNNAHIGRKRSFRSPV